MLVLSKFNVYKSFEPNKIVIFNTFSHASIVIDKEFYYSLLRNNIRFDIQSLLYKLGILVSDDKNEYNIFLEEKYRISQCSKKNINITLFMTNKCNMVCPYCFNSQNRNEHFGYFNNKQITRVIGYLSNYIKHNSIESISVNYYGGEPTLYKDQIVEFQKKLLNFELPMYSKLTTNGTMLDEVFLINLSNLKLSDIQISLDGPGNNNKRILMDGTNSFYKITDSIKLASKILNKKILLRINADNNNLDKIYILLEEMSSFNLQECADLHIAQIFDKYIHNNLVTPSELLQIYKFAKELGFNTLDGWQNNIPFFQTCTHKNGNGFMIDYLGDIYSCHLLGREEKYKLTNINSPLYSFSSRNDKVDKYCIECKYLPICNSGCFYKNEVTSIDKPFCEYARYEYIMYYLIDKYKKLS